MGRRLTSFYRAAYRTDKARETQCCKRNRWLREQPKMSKLYVSPPRNRFPVKAAYTPPFRFHGMAGNRLLPHTVCKGEKTQRGRWNFTKLIIQINVEMSNKMSDLCRWKAAVCLDNFRSLGYNKNTRRCLREQAPPRGETPTVATTYKRVVCLRAKPSNREPSVAADGSLLFIVLLIVQIKHERHNAANGTDGSENSQKCRSYMYRLPGIDFP